MDIELSRYIILLIFNDAHQNSLRRALVAVEINALWYMLCALCTWTSNMSHAINAHWRFVELRTKIKHKITIDLRCVRGIDRGLKSGVAMGADEIQS